MNFLEKLDDFLLDKNMNKRQLSVATDIPYTTIDSFYKKGYDNIKLSTLVKLSDYFQCSLDYLVDEDNTDLANHLKPKQYDGTITPPIIDNEDFSLSKLEKNIILAYRDADEIGQAMVLRSLNIEDDTKSNNKKMA